MNLLAPVLVIFAVVPLMAQQPAAAGLPALKAAIADLERKFPAEYSGWSARLAALEQQSGLPGYQDKLRAFHRAALIASPLVSARPILYIQRHQYKPDHHNTETLFQHNEIAPEKYTPPGVIKSVDLRTGLVRNLVDGGPTAVARDLEVGYDGTKLLFSLRRSGDDDYHIHEADADGSNIRQLTRARGVSDIDPVYLPDGRIVFSSTREPKYCQCNRHIMANLFQMEADGANIHQIGKSTLFEGHASVMPDGRILYDRWEYVDRNFGDAQGLWTVNPDGTRHAIYYGNATRSPGGVIDARVLANGLCLCIFGSCHDRPWGAVALLDRSLGVDGRPAVLRTWPESAISLVDDLSPGWQANFDSFTGVRPRYEDPYPLDNNHFLVSRDVGGEEMAIFLIDTFGNEIELHRDAPGCYDPMPLAPRARPPVIPAARGHGDAPGHFYVQDVYSGTHMQGIKRGDVKFLRVVESPEKRSWINQPWTGRVGFAPGTQWPAVNWADLATKRVLGTVPVEADGSAYFECPADTFVFFQLLDKDGRMLQTMRSGTMLQSGESQGCVGCHEDRLNPAPVANNLVALTKPAAKLTGWHARSEPFSFARDVQPVLDRHCVRCHDFGKPAGNKLLLCGDRDTLFSASYKDLWSKNAIAGLGTGPATILQPRAWGAINSKLIKVLDAGHEGVKLSPEEMDCIVTWIDLNGPYYPSYDCAYPDGATGRSPLTIAQSRRLDQLCKPANGQAGFNPAISFDRPELSPCLAMLDKNSPAREEAVAIIRAGQQAFAANPEADREGFIPAAYARQRQEFYAKRKEQEQAVREAIRDKRKVYDP